VVTTVGSAECLRDEILAYPGGIWQAGGKAELHLWPGGMHASTRKSPGRASARPPSRPPQARSTIGTRTAIGRSPTPRQAYADRVPGNLHLRAACRTLLVQARTEQHRH
jgi:acetyl esterase/lipase